MQAQVRKALWRVGRKLYCFARGDLANEPQRNGEYWLLDKVVGAACPGAVFFDVGANKGEWTLHVLELARARQVSISVVAFEPCAGTRAILTQRLAGLESVQICAQALSSRQGAAEFFSNGAGSGTNSLSRSSGDSQETVELTTVDDFLDTAGLTRVSMLKIDTEGFDYGVLQGAEKALAAGKIEVVQFEYNWRWLINHASLRDVFELMKGKPYRLGKLTGSSVEIYDVWHAEMDRFFENNYVLIRNDSALVRLGARMAFDASNCPVPVNG